MICNCSQFPEETRSFSVHIAIKTKPTTILKIFFFQAKNEKHYKSLLPVEQNFKCPVWWMFTVGYMCMRSEIVLLLFVRCNYWLCTQAITIYPVLTTLLLPKKIGWLFNLSFPSPTSYLLTWDYCYIRGAKSSDKIPEHNLITES